MSKKVFSVTIDEELLSEWKEYTERECINSSRLIEKMLDDYLKKKKKGKEQQ